MKTSVMIKFLKKIHVEPKLREPIHFEILVILHIKDMNSKLISGVTFGSTYIIQLHSDLFLSLTASNPMMHHL